MVDLADKSVGTVQGLDGALFILGFANNRYSFNPENVTLYAMWTINTYEITLDSNGANNHGTAVYYEKYTEANYADVKTTSVITEITIPEKTGYTFEGYYLDGIQYIDADGTIIASTTAFYDNVTLTARWTANKYSVVYHANKPSGASGNVSGLPSTAQWTYDSNATLVAAPTLAGWTFGGWYRDAACTTKAGDAGKVLTKPNYSTGSNVTLYAKWTANTYTVVYNSNGGSGEMSTSTHAYDQSKVLLTNAFTRHGWEFLGWSTNSSATSPTYTDGQSVKNMVAEANGKITLYAVWSLKVTKTYSFNTFEVNNTIGGANGYYVTLTDYFDLTTLKNQGYTMKVTMNFTLKDIDAGSDGQYMYNMKIFNGPGDTTTKLYETGTKTILSGTKSLSYSTSISANSLSRNELGFLFTEETYSLFGVKTNSYNVIGLGMTVTFVK